MHIPKELNILLHRYLLSNAHCHIAIIKNWEQRTSILRDYWKIKCGIYAQQNIMQL